MYGIHESTQSVEINVFRPAVEGYQELLFQLDMDCVTHGTPAQLYGPAENCYEAEAPEFELDTIHVHMADGNLVKIEYDAFVAILGAEVAQKIIDDATDDAIENGNF